MEFEKVYGTYWAEDLPKGFYHVVLEVKYYDASCNKKVIGEVWKGCILGLDNECIMRSLEGSPNLGSPFYSQGKGKNYRMTVASFKTLEETELVKEAIDDKGSSDRMIEDAKYWATYYNNDYTVGDPFSNENVVKEVPKKVNQTTDQQVVQSLISKNAAKITDLEKQLRELRLIQKGLKKQR